MRKIRLLDVGQCGIDGPRMSRLFESKLSAEVDSAADLAETRQRLSNGDYDLVLVNRVLASDGSSGLDLIHELLNSDCDCPVMLVSDREDAQQQAVAKGAVRGFGKSQLTDPTVLEIICNSTRRD